MVRRRTTSFWTSVRFHWIQIIGEGAALVVLGSLAFILPALAVVSLDRLIGWLFVVSGLIGLITTLGTRHTVSFWWSLISAGLALAVGMVLMMTGTLSAIAVAYLLATFFAIEGFATIMYAIDHRRRLSQRWEWMVASGAVDISLAILVLLWRPETAAASIGILVGINMVFGGSALIAMGVYAHSEALRRQRDAF